VIGESGADVIGVQEATNWPTTNAKTQVQDLQNVVAPYGYVPPVFPASANECARPRNASGQLSGPSPCENTAALLFRAATVRQVPVPAGQSAGIVMAGSIAPGIDPASASRSVAWAYLQGNNGAGPFLAVSVHTATAKDAVSEASRVALGQALTGWTDNWNTMHGMPGVPVVVMADLNSYAKRQPAGMQRVLTDAGWLDGWNAPSRRNIQYSTINYNPVQVDGTGFPARPYAFQVSKKNPLGQATRIDYVLARGAGLSMLDYEVVAYLQGDGTFNPDYQGSDHQMVKTVIAFG
jgi:endonuclease/exonuclease/phosphatase family metal-dependent hydrolase